MDKTVSLLSSTNRDLERKRRMSVAPVTYRARMLGKKKGKKLAKCPKKEGEEWKNYFGKGPKEKCKKCKSHWKLKDYVDVVNKSRAADDGFRKSCKKILLDPMIHKAKIPAAYKKLVKGKPYKHCLMRNQVFLQGRKGVTKFLSYLKGLKSKKLKKVHSDPCQSYNNYLHAKYMAKSNCLVHYEQRSGGKAISPKSEKCDGKLLKGNKKASWRQRAAQFGHFKSGTEIVGVIPSKLGFNPTLLTCVLGLDDHDTKQTNRKALYNSNYHFFGIGTFKSGMNIYYSVSLLSDSECKKESKILANKKWCKAQGVNKGEFKAQGDKNKKHKKAAAKKAKKGKKDAKKGNKGAKKGKKDAKKGKKDAKKGKKGAKKGKKDAKKGKKDDKKKDDKKKDDKKKD